MTQAWHALTATVGGEGARFLFAGYGVAAAFFAGKTYASAPAELLTAPGAWVLHGWALSALVAAIVGPRRGLLGLTALLAIRAVVSNHLVDEPLLWFPAAEWPLFVALPLVGALARDDDEVIGGFRIAAVAALFFAGLHKINADYFDPVVSCHRLSARLSTWWALPEVTHAWVTPHVVVALEIGTPLLLLLAPRAGVLLALLMLSHFVSIGATALSTVIAVSCLAFLHDSDRRALVSAWPLALVPAAAGVVASGLLYQGPWSWPQYGACHGLFAAMISGAAWRLWVAGPGVRTGVRLRRPLLAVAAVAWLLNGLAPYSGLKFQYSFAMLSNLRVDDDRHNAWLFPSALRLRHDPYVHVRSATYRRAATGQPLSGGYVQPDLWTPGALVEQLDKAEQIGEVLSLRGTWGGREITEADLRGLPPAPLFQHRLTLAAPQQCVH